MAATRPPNLLLLLKDRAVAPARWAPPRHHFHLGRRASPDIWLSSGCSCVSWTISYVSLRATTCIGSSDASCGVGLPQPRSRRPNAAMRRHIDFRLSPRNTGATWLAALANLRWSKPAPRPLSNPMNTDTSTHQL